MRKEKIILINQDEVCFEFSKKSEHYNAMQAIEFNNFGEMKVYYQNNSLWIEEGNKILRRRKLYLEMQKMNLSRIDINVESYRNDIYLNSVVKFQMNMVEQNLF